MLDDARAGLELEDTVRAASSRLHLDWRVQLGPDRFDTLWTALQQLTGRTGAPPELDALQRRAAGLDDRPAEPARPEAEAVRPVRT